MAAKNEVKLLGFLASPFVMRVRIALMIKGVEYEFLPETVGEKSELLLKSNPVYKKTPVLIHNGNPIPESMIIVQYVDEVWSSGQAILPSDPYDRAVARFWTVFIDDKLWPVIFGSFMGQDEAAQYEAIIQISPLLLVLEKEFEMCSKNKEKNIFLGGNAIGYLDIALGCFIGWLGAVGELSGVNFLDEEKTPFLVSWAKHFTSIEAVKEAIPKIHELVEFAKLLQMKYGIASRAK